MAEENSDGENIVGEDDVRGALESSDEEEEFDGARGQPMQGFDLFKFRRK